VDGLRSRAHRYPRVITGARPQPTSGSVSTLRGASVSVDVRWVKRSLACVVLAGLAATSALLFWAGASRNARIQRLRSEGVEVPVTVSGCLGLLGGSGSNAAGYECRGTFRLAGHEYRTILPGDGLLAAGSVVEGVAVPGHPPLFSTAKVLAGERPSAGVYLVPALMAGLLLASVLLAGWRLRRGPGAEPGR